MPTSADTKPPTPDVAAATDAALADDASPALPPRSPLAALRRLVITFGIWYLYVPHLAVMRLVGPAVAVRLTRVMAWMHWLLTFAGGQKAALRAIERNRPYFETKLSTRTILRKYLETKHHHFVVWNLCATPRGRAWVERTCTAFEGRETFEKARTESRGLLVLGYHFGSGRMLSITQARQYGQDAYEIAHRPETYGRDTMSYVARLAYDKAAEADEKSGLQHIFLSPGTPPLSAIRHLRKGHIVGIVGDGFMAGQFIDVPFLGGTMRFPIGVARLAAMAGCSIVPMFGLVDGVDRHHVVAHEPIRIEGDTPEEVERVMRACAAVLESYVRRYPWAWWIWHRLKLETNPDGSLRMTCEAITRQSGH